MEMTDNREPLISIIVPVYEVEEYLDQCVRSIVNQTYKNLEIILVDDGSGDKCPRIIDNWAKKDSRIKTIHKANGGLSSARNAGMEYSTGEYISFVDSDDWLELDFIELLFKAIKLYDAEVSVGGYKRVNEEREIGSRFFINSESLFYSCVTEKAIKYFFEISIAAWGKLYHRSVMEGTKFIEGRLAEDIPYQMEILRKTPIVSFCNKHLYNYRIRNNSIAHTLKPKYLFDHIKSLSEAYDICVSQFNFEINYCCNWLSALLYEFMAADNFGREEKIQNKETLEYALQQVGGREKLLCNLEDDLGVLFYTYSQFETYMCREEKKKIQFDYRKQFSFGKIKKYGKHFFVKYLPSYFSLRFTENLSRCVIKRKRCG